MSTPYAQRAEKRLHYIGETNPEVHPEAKRAKACACDEPATYRDEDGDRRCLCGRRVGP